MILNLVGLNSGLRGQTTTGAFLLCEELPMIDSHCRDCVYPFIYSYAHEELRHSRVPGPIGDTPTAIIGHIASA